MAIAKQIYRAILQHDDNNSTAFGQSIRTTRNCVYENELDDVGRPRSSC